MRRMRVGCLAPTTSVLEGRREVVANFARMTHLAISPPKTVISEIGLLLRGLQMTPMSSTVGLAHLCVQVDL